MTLEELCAIARSIGVSEAMKYRYILPAASSVPMMEFLRKHGEGTQTIAILMAYNRGVADAIHQQTVQELGN